MSETDSRTVDGRAGGSATLPPARADVGSATITVRGPQRPVQPEQVLAARALSEPGEAIRRRISRPFVASVGGAHLLGGLAVFVLLAVVFPVPVEFDRAKNTLFNLYVFLPFMVLAWLLGAGSSRLVWRPVERWLVQDRPPDQREIELTLRQPLHQAASGAAVWVLAAVVFAALNARVSLALSGQVGLVVLDAGLVTCCLSYLLLERTLRPVTARALAFGLPAQSSVPGVRTRILLAWVFGTGVLLSDIALVALMVLWGNPASIERLAVTVVVLSLAAFAVGLAAIRVAASSVADPVESVRSAMAQVERGETDVEAPVYDGSEIGRLQAGFNRMVAGLRERELLQDLFGRHVGEDVARQAVERGLELGGEAREVALLFVDLIGSTAMATRRDPTEVMETLNSFFGIVVEEVSLHGGWVNKFEGDAALCVFGAPTAHPDAARGALATGRSLRDRLARELPGVEAAIGLSAGQVVAGNVGAAERYEYTVIGDPVNEAARLTELAKSQPGRLLASEAVVARAGPAEAARWDMGESVTLRGRDRPTRLATPRAP